MTAGGGYGMVGKMAAALRVDAADERVLASLAGVGRTLDAQFLDKQEITRLLLISIVAGEHLVLIGPPGTAKSAMVRLCARLIDARYFEYLLTRFSEPNELFGPVDIRAFREGHYTRKTETMLPDAEVVFLDEIFRANSAILNSLLTILNERKYSNGARLQSVPLLSLFAASNEVPNDEALQAVFDRFLLRVVSDNLDSYQFSQLVERGLAHERARLAGDLEAQAPLVKGEELRSLHQRLAQYLIFPEEFLAKYKSLIFQIRSEGISISDRRVVKLLKLIKASALLDGRTEPNDSDFFVLRHIWNNLDQREILDEITAAILGRYYHENPNAPRLQHGQAGLEDLLTELKVIRDLLVAPEPLSDIQLFSQLRNLNQIKAALQAVPSETATRMIGEIDKLLESVFASSRFGSSL